MRKLILLTIFLVFSKVVFGQKYKFSPKGTMPLSQFYADTIIQTKLKPNGKIIFSYLDSAFTDSFHIRSLFPQKYNSIMHDSFSYFICINLSKKPIHFDALKDNLVAEELFTNGQTVYQPISYFFFVPCGTSFPRTKFVVHPSCLFIIKQLVKRTNSLAAIKPNCMVRFQTRTNGILNALYYRNNVEKTQFFLPSVFEKDYPVVKYRFAFLGK